jgi:bile acid:Na+ symporter, BASS family
MTSRVGSGGEAHNVQETPVDVISHIAKLLTQNVVTSLMLVIGLRTTPAMLRSTWQERGLVARALIVLELGVPVLALAVVIALPLTLQATVAIAVMSICPGAPMVLQRIHDRAVVLVIVALVSILAPITVLAWLEVLNPVLSLNLGVSPLTLAEFAVVKVMLPVISGIAIAATAPRAAKIVERAAWFVFVVGFAVAIALVLWLGAPALAKANPWAIGAVLAVVLGSAAMGHWVGAPRIEDSSAVAMIAVLGNPALALAVVSYSYPGYEPGALLAAYILARTLALLPYAWFVKRRQHRTQSSVVHAHA